MGNRLEDSYIRCAEIIVARWIGLLKNLGVIHGELSYADELVDIIVDELERRDNVTKESEFTK